jgi:Domain of unknown function (DUF4136)
LLLKEQQKVVTKMTGTGRAFRLVAVCGVLLLCGAHAAAQDIHYNYQQGTDFSKYKTYKWVRVPGAQYPNQILDEQIRQAIDAQMSLKGLSRTEGDDPDLFVIYQAAVNQEKEWNAYSSGGTMWGYGGWGGWGGMQTTTVTSSTINVGTLNLDIYDVATKKQIWRGEATKSLKQNQKPEKLQKNLNKAMAKLLKNYPPPVK